MIYKKLSSIADIQAGGTPSRTKLEYWNGNIPWIKISDIKEKYVTSFEEEISEDGLNNSSAKLFPKNTILYTIFATLGRVGILTFEAATNQAIAGICIKDQNITLNYLYYFLKSTEKHVNAIGNGVAQKNINLSILKNLDVPLRPLDNQRQISATLNCLEQLIAIEKNQLFLLDELVKSRFIEMFGDPLLNQKGFKTELLSKACLFNDYKGNIDSVDGKYWILNLDKIESNTGKVLEKVYQSLDEIGDSTISFDENCVLYSKLRPYLNKVVIPDSKGYGTSELISMQVNEKINKYFLASLLRSDSFVAYINSKTAGSKMPRASMDVLRNFNLMIPNITAQNRFAAFVEQVDKSKFVVHSRYFLCDILTLFSSTMA